MAILQLSSTAPYRSLPKAAAPPSAAKRWRIGSGKFVKLTLALPLRLPVFSASAVMT
jgi:hypothetical protein